VLSNVARVLTGLDEDLHDAGDIEINWFADVEDVMRAR
jgi:hypothetical protein